MCLCIYKYNSDVASEYFVDLDFTYQNISLVFIAA